MHVYSIYLTTYNISSGDLLNYDKSKSDKSRAGSLGCAVLHNVAGKQVRGFLTAAHVGLYEGNNIYYGGKKNEITPVYMGIVTKKFQMKGKVDACIISDGMGTATSVFNYTGKTGDGKWIGYQRTSPLSTWPWPFSTKVYAYGAASGAMSGYINNLLTSVEVRYEVDGPAQAFNDFYSTSLGAQRGDSGCAVVVPYNNSYSMVGIVTGSRYKGKVDIMPGPKESETLVCQIQEINKAFNSSVSK